MTHWQDNWPKKKKKIDQDQTRTGVAPKVLFSRKTWQSVVTCSLTGKLEVNPSTLECFVKVNFRLTTGAKLPDSSLGRKRPIVIWLRERAIHGSVRGNAKAPSLSAWGPGHALRLLTGHRGNIQYRTRGEALKLWFCYQIMGLQNKACNYPHWVYIKQIVKSQFVQFLSLFSFLFLSN